MKLSIITVNLNNCDGLKKTINSVVSQTFHDFEWIIIDGGSTDGSRELLEKYSSHFSYWVSEPDKGIYNAMNKAVMHANGEYLQFLNSGDWLSSNTTLSDAFSEEYDEDIIYGNIYTYKNDVQIGYYEYPDKLSLMFLIMASLGHNSTFIKRKLLLDCPYDENLRIVSDWKFFILALIGNKTFRHINTYIGCFDTSGVTFSNSEKSLKEREQVMDEIFPVNLRHDVNSIMELQKYLRYNTIDSLLSKLERHRIMSNIIKCLVFLIMK